MGLKAYNENDIQNIANSIRNKGVSGNFTVAEMASNIDNIPSGGGADLSNSIVWDTYNGPYIGGNVNDLRGAFAFKSFNNGSWNYLNISNRFTILINTFCGVIGNPKVNFVSNTYNTGLRMDYAFKDARYDANFINVIGIGNALKYANSARSCFQRSDEQAPGFYFHLPVFPDTLEVLTYSNGGDIENFASCNFGFINTGINNIVIGSDVALLNYANNAFHSASINGRAAVLTNLSNISGSGLQMYSFCWNSSVSEINVHAFVNVTSRLCYTTKNLVNAQLNVIFETQFNLTHAFYESTIKSSRISIISSKNVYHYGSSYLFVNTFLNCNYLSTAWIEILNIKESAFAAPVSWVNAFKNCSLRNLNIYLGFDTSNLTQNYVNNLFKTNAAQSANAFNTNKSHTTRIVVNNLFIYNCIRNSNSFNGAGILSGTEVIESGSVIFNFYNGFNASEVNYSNTVNTARYIFDSGRNVYLYCTE